MKPVLTELPITTAKAGFYSGFNRIVALGSKILIGALILWAALFPGQANNFFVNMKNLVNANFGTWYMYVVIFFILTCFALALWPRTGRLRLGKPDEKPEFSRFSWFSMLFGAGIGIGMMTFATAEPIYQFSTNPEIIKGAVESQSLEAVRSAYRWSFLHWGLSAWACYALVGLALGFFAYSRDLPLTIRSSLVPLFGARMSGVLGHAVDIVAVLATVRRHIRHHRLWCVSICLGPSQYFGGRVDVKSRWLADHICDAFMSCHCYGRVNSLGFVGRRAGY